MRFNLDLRRSTLAAPRYINSALLHSSSHIIIYFSQWQNLFSKTLLAHVLHRKRLARQGMQMRLSEARAATLWFRLYGICADD